MRFVVITGPSGAGKTLALHSLEDAGYYCVDNLPPGLLPALMEFCKLNGLERGAAVIDTRSGAAFASLAGITACLKDAGTPVEILYLDASDTILLHRYKETRRPHPLRTNSVAGGILQIIAAERELLDGARALADNILDTSTFSAAKLREMVHSTYAADTRPGLQLTVVSFGFKYGLPVDADLVFDVRFLVNPHYVPELRELDGRDKRVADYVYADANSAPFEAKMRELILFCLPEYVREGKAYLNIAIGCTGGQHRSVALAESLAGFLSGEGYTVNLHHRDVGSHKRLDPE